MANTHYHHVHRSGWLRAAVLGADDGLISVSSLLLGMASAGVVHGQVLLAGFAGLVAGAAAMAAGEYVSVSSQADMEHADLDLERAGIVTNLEAEQEELASLYVGRGLEPPLANEVARQLMAHDALAAHARDELGISETLRARPLQAAVASAASFTAGATVPLIAAAIAPADEQILIVIASTLISLAVVGGVGARTGGAPIARGSVRVLLWGCLAMFVTAALGHFVGPMF